MRYTPTLKLSTRLTAFVTIIVISAMFILFIGGTISFRSVGQEYLNRYLDSIVAELDQEMAKPDALKQMAVWAPKLLRVSSVVEMTLSASSDSLYQFSELPPQLDKTRLYEKIYTLPSHPDYRVYFKVLPPYLSYSYSFGAFSSIALAILLVIFCLMRGVRWLENQLKGSELLEERGRMILAGKVADHAKGDEQEWPYTASEALDVLIEELQDARQERSRFDTFIRTHTFLDQLTGAANRVLFESKLESMLQESGAMGGVLLLRIAEWEQLVEQGDKQAIDSFVVEVGQIFFNIVQRYPDVVFSRYFDSDFAVLVPYQSSKDLAVLANQCMRQLGRLTPPLENCQADNWCHMGLTMYSEGERRGHIIAEVETALKSAQLQEQNNWSRFSKRESKQYSRGSVRWRTLFDKSFQRNQILIYEQPCYLVDPTRRSTLFQHEKVLLHHELFTRINDDGVGILKASRFISAIEQVGYEMQMDRTVLSAIFLFLKAADLSTCYSLNVYVLPFKDKAHIRWLRDELLQLSASTRSRLSFEFVEGHLVKHLDYMRPVVKMLAGLGCTIIVGQAGRTITSTHYIKDLGVHYLKLHRNLVNKVDQRQENQLFIRSLAGACEGTETKVIAVGIETSKEWQTLLELGVSGGQGRLFQKEVQLIPKPEHTPVKLGRRNRWRKKQ